MRIAFDIDGTLIRKYYTGRDVPRHDILDLLFWYKMHGWHVIVWSGGGIDYCKEWVEKLGIAEMVEVMSKDEYHNVDISVDDEDVELAKVNIRV